MINLIDCDNQRPWPCSSSWSLGAFPRLRRMATAIVVYLLRKIWISEEWIREQHENQSQGLVLNTWWREPEPKGSNPRQLGQQARLTSDCCCLWRSVTVETKKWHRATDHTEIACLPNSFLLNNTPKNVCFSLGCMNKYKIDIRFLRYLLVIVHIATAYTYDGFH